MRDQQKPLAEINVVPYIDVMLVLLVIFMITAPLLMQGVQVELPDAHANALPENSEPPIVVSVDVNGQYFLNISEHPDEPVNLHPLQVRVAAELKMHPDRAVMVKGDRYVDYGKVVQAMVWLQQAGANQVGLVTEELDKKA